MAAACTTRFSGRPCKLANAYGRPRHPGAAVRAGKPLVVIFKPVARNRGCVGHQTARRVTETPATPGEDLAPAEAAGPAEPVAATAESEPIRSRGPVAGGFESHAQEHSVGEDTNVTPTQVFQRSPDK
jgi:hypothetical protein